MGVGVAVPVLVGVAVGVLVPVLVGVADGVSVPVGVFVAVPDGVLVGVLVGVAVSVGVGVSVTGASMTTEPATNEPAIGVPTALLSWPLGVTETVPGVAEEWNTTVNSVHAEAPQGCPAPGCTATMWSVPLPTVVATSALIKPEP